MSPTAAALAYLAGLLSTLSPCVLPLLPIVLGSAAGVHRFGPLALAAGLALAYTATGLFVATIGFAVGLDGAIIRTVSAVLMIVVGLVLVVPPLQARLAVAGGPIGDWANAGIDAAATRGLPGQFGVGALLGALWSPCVGPTLGAASLLAAQGRSLPSVALVMLAFGFGAATPLAIIGLVSRQALQSRRGALMNVGKKGKSALGIALALIGIATISGFDHRLETWLVDHSPDWLTTLSTSI